METKGLSKVAPVFVEYFEYLAFLASALEGGNLSASSPTRFTSEKEPQYRLNRTPQRPHRRARSELHNLCFATQSFVMKLFSVDCDTKLCIYLLLTHITSISFWKEKVVVNIVSCSHTVAMSAWLSCYIKWHRQFTNRIASHSGQNYRICRTKEYFFFLEVAVRVRIFFVYFEE